MTGSLFGVGAVIVMSSVRLCVPPLLSFASITMIQAVLDRVAGAVIVSVPDDTLTMGFEAVQVESAVLCLKVKVWPSGSVKYGASGMV